MVRPGAFNHETIHRRPFPTTRFRAKQCKPSLLSLPIRPKTRFRLLRQPMNSTTSLHHRLRQSRPRRVLWRPCSEVEIWSAEPLEDTPNTKYQNTWGAAKMGYLCYHLRTHQFQTEEGARSENRCALFKSGRHYAERTTRVRSARDQNLSWTRPRLNVCPVVVQKRKKSRDQRFRWFRRPRRITSQVRP